MSTVTDDTGIWSLYSKPQAAPPWVYVKVCAHGWRKGKANFWLSWSGTRFAEVGDIVRMGRDKPELLALAGEAAVAYEARDLF